MLRRFPALMRRRGARGIVRGGGGGPNYLMTYSSNPIFVDASGVGAEVVPQASVGAPFWSGAWRIDVVPSFPSSELDYRYIFADASGDFYILKWNKADQYNLRLSGVTYTQYTIVHAAGDTVTHYVDMVAGRWGISINGAAPSYVAISGTAAPGDVHVGESRLAALPWYGGIYQPIEEASP